MTRRLAILAVLSTACTTGCRPSLPADEAAVLASEGSLLLQEHPRGAIARDDWPGSIERLGANHVHAAPEGLYIRTASFFAQEWGFFVPRPSSPIVAGPGTDPSYELVVPGLFTYCIKA